MRQTVTLRLQDGTETTIRSLVTPPVLTIGPLTSSSQFGDTTLAPFANKTYARVGDTLVYEEVEQ